ncbi:MAG: helix-turn-helix domain-containing protein [Actinomycetota bacterium]
MSQIRQRLGLSYAQMGVRAKLDGSTIHKMEKTGRGSMEAVVQVARAFGEDVNEWLVLAGYEPIEDASQLLDAGLYRIWQETGVIVTYNGWKPAGELTPEEVREYLQIAREEAGKG